MRYRIVIEIETDARRVAVNNLACDMRDLAAQVWCKPVYASTEIIKDQETSLIKL